MKTTVSALSGRVIEKVEIYHEDSECAPSLSIVCVGGTVFNFTPKAQLTVKAESWIAREDKHGRFVDERRRMFKSNLTHLGEVDE